MESKNDSIMVSLGIVVLLIALMGSAVFEGEKPEGDASLFNVLYKESTQDVFSAGDYTAEGESWNSPMDIAGPPNMVSLEFVLTWTDDDTTEGNVNGLGVQNQPDTFSLTVTMPNGTTLTEEAASDVGSEAGIITITAVLQSFPKNEIAVVSESNSTLERELMKENGFGNWTITVTCEEADDSQTTTGQTVASDDGNAWNLRVTAEAFLVTISEYQPGEER